jgi:predicted DNA repair protein MutK
VPHAVHSIAHALAEPIGAMSGIVEWLANAIGASLVGLIVGLPIVYAVRLVHNRRHAHRHSVEMKPSVAAPEEE